MDARFPISRPRRWRGREALRRMARETFVWPGDLVLPLFVRAGIAQSVPLKSLPGHAQLTVDDARKQADRARAAGIGGVILFGVPESGDRNPSGSAAASAEGIVQQALARMAADGGRDDPLVKIADVCLCEYTSHGHCGLVEPNADGGFVVQNDQSLPHLARSALSLAQAGADVVAPSDMMDGRVAAIRALLDREGRTQTLILSYAVKYASSFYGPFREAAGSAPGFGDRKSYQMDPANRREALREARLDLEEGADALMVKPAISYLDIVSDIARAVDVPVAAYCVSGETAMVKAAAERGWCDEQSAAMEMLTSIKRAGASIILTYWALAAAGWCAEDPGK